MRLSLFIAILCCTVKVFTVVKGLYQARITLYQYNNTPPGKCHGCTNVFTAKEQHQGCCDDPTNNDTCIGDDLCDVYFTYCLRPFGSTGRGCSNYTNVTSNVENDTSSFSFPQQNMSDVENDTSPFSFPQQNMSDVENDTDSFSFPKQNMSLNVLGLPNPLLLPGLTDAYTGEGVQLYIEIWDADPPGFQKPDELVDILLIDHNESVGEESTTRVHSGMYGFVSMELVINVTCIKNFQVTDCSQCVPGFTGPNCQQTDNCVGVNCSGNGQCENGVNSFSCSCDPGFTGKMCQTNIDDCVGGRCSGNGECLDGVNSFTCECSPGYTGPLCDIQVSSSSSVGPSVGGIVGGVIGAILVMIILIVILVLVVVVALRQSKKKAETNSPEKQKGFQALPRNNPEFKLQEGNIPSYMSPGFHYEIIGPKQDQERGCGNQVSGTDVTSSPVYTTPSVNKAQESTLEHEFHNIIYGCEPEAHTYSVISDPSATTAFYDTVTDKEQQIS